MTVPLRTLVRGLSVLRALNINNGAGLRQLATETKLSRGAVHRLLETLVTEGYARVINGRYFVELKVQSLTSGLEGEWVIRAQPLIEELCRQVKWPISLTKPSGQGMERCASTDRISPLRHHVAPLGLKIPLLTSAAGRAYFAFLPEGVQSLMIDSLARHAEFQEDQDLCQTPAAVADMLASVRKAGAALAESINRSSVLAVPILTERGEVLGSLCLRYFTASLTPREVMKRHLAQMQESATAIGRLAATPLPPLPEEA